MQWKKNIEKILFYFILVCIAIWLIASLQSNNLPTPEEIHPLSLKQPTQRSTNKKPFFKKVGEVTYEIQPLFEYELSGLVVSYRNFNESWYSWFITLKRDPFNTKDLCVIWGENLITPSYKKYSFSSGEFTCYVKIPPNTLFYDNALSNNHLLTGNPEIAQEVMSAKTGDQIYLKGQLVAYKNTNMGRFRKSSMTRTDRGNSACEVVYLTDFKILKEGNPLWTLIHHLSKALTIFAGLILITMKLLWPGIPYGLKSP